MNKVLKIAIDLANVLTRSEVILVCLVRCLGFEMQCNQDTCMTTYPIITRQN